MLYITESLFSKALESIQKYNLEEVLNKKRYTKSDTPLTYRQVNTLDSDNLLNDRRQHNKGWRKFSFKELIYVNIVFELKKFGVKHEQIKQLWQSFFKKRERSQELSLEPNGGDSTLALACAFGGVEMSISLDSDGNINIFDPAYSARLSQSDKPLIKLSLNKAIKDVIKGDIPSPVSLVELILNRKVTLNSKKEEDLLKIIRNKQYNSIKVKKINGEISVVYAEKQNSEGELEISKLKKLIEAKEYQDIQLTKRDGKIVNYKVEETFKL